MKSQQEIDAEAYDAAALAVERAAEVYQYPDASWTEEDWIKVQQEMMRIATELRNS